MLDAQTQPHLPDGGARRAAARGLPAAAAPEIAAASDIAVTKLAAGAAAGGKEVARGRREGVAAGAGPRLCARAACGSGLMGCWLPVCAVTQVGKYMVDRYLGLSLSFLCQSIVSAVAAETGACTSGKIGARVAELNVACPLET